MLIIPKDNSRTSDEVIVTERVAVITTIGKIDVGSRTDSKTEQVALQRTTKALVRTLIDAPTLGKIG